MLFTEMNNDCVQSPKHNFAFSKDVISNEYLTTQNIYLGKIEVFLIPTLFE